MNSEEIIAKLQELIATYGLRVVAAIVILIVGWWIAKLISSMMRKMASKKNLDPTIVSFIANLTYVGLMTFVILAVLNQLGVQTTSFIAVIGAAGLAVGLALQGALANFAAGVLMIMFRPFKVGDFIEAAGVMGVVEEIQLFTTRLKTPDNKAIIVPNNKITGDNITNFSANDQRRIDMVFGVSYGDDIDKVKKIINEVIAQEPRILKDPAPTVALMELADSSVNFAVRPWAKTSDYWGVKFDVTEKLKKRFDAEGVSIPFPQRDVHLYKHDKE